MGKKGETMLFWVMEMFAAVLIVYILVSAAHGFGTKDVFDKSRITKDISLQIDALQGVSGNAYIENKGIGEYSYYFRDNNLKVATRTETEPLAQSYSYTLGKDEDMQKLITKPEVLYVSSIGGRIEVSDKKPNLMLMNCPVVKTEDSDWSSKKIQIDYEDQSRNLAESFLENMKYIGNSNTNLMNGDEQKKINELKNDQSEYVYIKLNFPNDSENNNNIKAYISYNSPDETKLKSYKLACNMINYIIQREELKDIEFTGNAVIPVSNDDILNAANGRVAVRLEIGNMLHESGKRLPSNIAPISLALKDAVLAYYKVENE